MPYLTIDTNADVAVTDAMLSEASSLVASTLGKPISYVVVKIDSSRPMAFGGRAETPGALIEMRSIGYGNKKSELAEKLTAFAGNHFNADAANVAIHFIDMPADSAAQGGHLFG